MKAKTKITSTLEIFFSTLIFVVVAFSAVNVLISMNQKGKNVESLNSANECRREIENTILSSYARADISSSSIFAIEKQGGGYFIKEIDKLPGKRGEFTGFLALKSEKNSEQDLSLVMKVAENGRTFYEYGSTKTDKIDEIRDGANIEAIIDKDLIGSLSSCSTPEPNLNISNPFKIAEVQKYLENPSSKNSYDLEVDDFIYSPQSNNISSRLFLREAKVYE